LKNYTQKYNSIEINPILTAKRTRLFQKVLKLSFKMPWKHQEIPITQFPKSLFEQQLLPFKQNIHSWNKTDIL
jgi:hypothetical protein